MLYTRLFIEFYLSGLEAGSSFEAEDPGSCIIIVLLRRPHLGSKFPTRWQKKETGATHTTPSLRMKTNQSPRRSRTLVLPYRKVTPRLGEGEPGEKDRLKLSDVLRDGLCPMSHFTGHHTSSEDRTALLLVPRLLTGR